MAECPVRKRSEAGDECTPYNKISDISISGSSPILRDGMSPPKDGWSSPPGHGTATDDISDVDPDTVGPIVIPPSPDLSSGRAVAEVLEELETVSEQLQKLKTKYYLLTMENNCHKDMVKTLETHTTHMQAELSHLQEEIGTRSNNEVKLAGIVNDLTAQRAALQESQRQDASVYNLVEEIRKELHRTQTANMELESDNRNLNARMKKLGNAEDDKSKLICELGARNLSLEGKLKEMTGRVQEKEEGEDGHTAEDVPSKSSSNPTSATARNRPTSNLCVVS